MRSRDLVTDETKTLVSYNETRYESEPEYVQDLRRTFAILIDQLVVERNALPRSEKSRNLQISITHLEDACIRAVKAAYL